MARHASVECDLINAANEQKLRTVRLALVPRVGDELDLDLGDRASAGGLYRVVRVLYHVRPRKLVRTDDLLGVSLYIEPAR
jgi:hypothetical protein